MIFTSTCAGCHEPGPQLCRRCRFTLASASSVRVDGGIRAAVPFDGLARQLVLGLKFRNRRSVAKVLATQMIQRLRLSDGRIDVITWAPTSTTRAGKRGFDQAELIARAIAHELRIPCRRLLYRQHHSGPQSGQRRSGRLNTPRFRARVGFDQLHVLVVDDVVTTGATLHAAGQALAQAGIGRVSLVAAAAAGAQVLGPSTTMRLAC